MTLLWRQQSSVLSSRENVLPQIDDNNLDKEPAGAEFDKVVADNDDFCF